MPDAIALYAVLVWFLVGFFVGAGWALGSWMVNRILSL